MLLSAVSDPPQLPVHGWEDSRFKIQDARNYLFMGAAFRSEKDRHHILNTVLLYFIHGIAMCYEIKMLRAIFGSVLGARSPGDGTNPLTEEPQDHNLSLELGLVRVQVRVRVGVWGL